MRENLERRVFVTWADVLRVIKAAPGAEWKALIAFVRLTGCRVPSGLQGLTWADVDMVGRNIVTRSPKTAHRAARENTVELSGAVGGENGGPQCPSESGVSDQEPPEVVEKQPVMRA